MGVHYKSGERLSPATTQINWKKHFLFCRLGDNLGAGAILGVFKVRGIREAIIHKDMF